jgi:hypothetical protein
MRHFGFVLLVAVALTGCSRDDWTPVAATPSPPTGPFLGHTPPGDTPELFIATPLAERDTAWTPDGTELYHSVYERNRGVIVVRRQLPDGTWSEPEFAPFSGEQSDLEPFITADGAWLFFISKRPLPGETDPGDYNLWRVPRVGDGWGSPEPLAGPVNSEHQEFYPSLTRDGDLVFTSDRPGGLGGEDLWIARADGGGWDEPSNLGAAVNTPGPEFNSLIAPDGSWLIFGSAREGDQGGGDMYIAFRGSDGRFLPAFNMGEPVNSSALDYCPALSPDGEILFFTSSRVPVSAPIPTSYAELKAAATGPANGRDNIWWVSAELIDQLRESTADSE